MSKDSLHTVSIEDIHRGGGTQGGSAGWLVGMQGARVSEIQDKEEVPLQVEVFQGSGFPKPYPYSH